MAGSLTGALYTTTYAYDALDRLTSGPSGNYVYDNAQRLDAGATIGKEVAMSNSAGAVLENVSLALRGLGVVLVAIGILSALATRHREYLLLGMWLIAVLVASVAISATGWPVATDRIGPQTLTWLIWIAIWVSLVASLWMGVRWVRQVKDPPRGTLFVLLAGIVVSARTPYPVRSSWADMAVVIVGVLVPEVLVLGVAIAHRRPRGG